MLEIFKKTKDPASRRSGLKIGGKLVDGYELRAPSHQNAVELIPGWTTKFPDELGVDAGGMDLLHDGRLHWAMQCYGEMAGKRLMELGPLEGAHTAMLDAAGAHVDAIESSGLAYLKCLITKEVLGLRNARFFLGDCNAWLEEHDTRYDMIVASGILYHMQDPMRLLRLLASRTDDLYLWTMVIDDETINPTRIEPFMGMDVRLHVIEYGKRTNSFCGGANPQAMWMDKNDLLAVLELLGFTTVITEHAEVNKYGSAISLFASRRPAVKPETMENDVATMHNPLTAADSGMEDAPSN